MKTGSYSSLSLEMLPLFFIPGGKAEEEQTNTITRCLYLGLYCNIVGLKLSTLTT